MKLRGILQGVIRSTREAEMCLAIVQQILEAKMDDTYQGPTANQPKKCPLPRIGSKDWGWQYHKASNMHTTALSGYFVLNGDVNCYAEVRQRAGGVCIDGIESHATAKRIAELLARRDWRMENRGKK